MRVGIDTGGTFTDLVAVDDTGAWRRAKVPSTPRDPLVAVLDAMAQAGVEITAIRALTLGTTVGTNALLERRGARVAYVTTEGFEDVPFIGRGNRPSPYDLHWRKPLPLLRRRHCLGVRERLDHRGAVVTPLEDAELERLGRRLERLVAAERVDAVAVSLLFSYVDPVHERRIGAWIAERLPRLEVSLSHEVAPVWREFERGLTTIADAYLKPRLRTFISRLEQQLAAGGFRGSCMLLKSNGGTRLAAHAAGEPVQLLLSGLAGGVIGATRLAGAGDLITLDMGGTSCDIAVVQGGAPRHADGFAPEFGLPLTFPTIDVATIGAGGGSIAWVDRGGFLRVGPRSAGADPGPACYGRQDTEPTVTDANLVLGRLEPDRFLGGRMPLDAARARRAVQRLATELGTTVHATAQAIVELADENMGNAIRERTVEVGIDPEGFSLVAFGGAGPLHACAVARRLGIRRVVVPPAPGLCSALGVLAADPRSDQLRTTAFRSDALDHAALSAVVAELVAAAHAELRDEGVTRGHEVRVVLGLRYAGQNHEHEVELPEADPAAVDRAFARFARLYEDAYGFRVEDAPIELVRVLATATCETGVPLPAPPAGARDAVPSGWTAGPAILHEADSTTFVDDGDSYRRLPDGTLVIDVTPAAARRAAASASLS